MYQHMTLLTSARRIESLRFIQAVCCGIDSGMCFYRRRISADLLPLQKSSLLNNP